MQCKSCQLTDSGGGTSGNGNGNPNDNPNATVDGPNNCIQNLNNCRENATNKRDSRLKIARAALFTGIFAVAKSALSIILVVGLAKHSSDLYSHRASCSFYEFHKSMVGGNQNRS